MYEIRTPSVFAFERRGLPERCLVGEKSRDNSCSVILGDTFAILGILKEGDIGCGLSIMADMMLSLSAQQLKCSPTEMVMVAMAW